MVTNALVAVLEGARYIAGTSSQSRLYHHRPTSQDPEQRDRDSRCSYAIVQGDRKLTFLNVLSLLRVVAVPITDFVKVVTREKHKKSSDDFKYCDMVEGNLTPENIAAYKVRLLHDRWHHQSVQDNASDLPLILPDDAEHCRLYGSVWVQVSSTRYYPSYQVRTRHITGTL